MNRKKVFCLIALLLIFSLLMTGCALIVKDPEVDAKQEILRLGDDVMTKEEVLKEIENELPSIASMYSSYGMRFDPSDPETLKQVRSQVVDALAERMVLKAKAKELGLDQFTPDEENHIQEHAKEHYQQLRDNIKASYFKDTKLTGDELEKAIDDKIGEVYQNQVTLDTFVEDVREEEKSEKLYDYATKDTAASEDEIKADYDSKVEADKKTYADKPDDCANAIKNGTTVYYTPAGIRRVKHILIKFEDADQTAISDASAKLSSALSKLNSLNPPATQTDLENSDSSGSSDSSSSDSAIKHEGSESADAATPADLAATEFAETQKAVEDAQKALDDAKKTAYEHIDEKADKVVAALESGEDWDKLSKEYNGDPGGKEGGPFAEKGYPVSAGITGYDPAFHDAAMALKKVGDISPKTKSESYGYYIIRYFADEKEGAADYDSVKDGIREKLDKEKKDSKYNETVEQWVKDSGIKKDIDALNN